MLNPKLVFMVSTRTASKSKVSGFTLLESIMAIVVATVLVVGIAPMLTVAVASRVQARRIDLATQAARVYIEGVRSGAIAIPARSTATIVPSTALNSEPAPTAISTNAGVRIDTNGNGDFRDVNDLVIQPIRNGLASTNGTSATNIQGRVDAYKQGFNMVVRVYRADAFDASGNAIGTLTTEPSGSIFSAGNGNPSAPLAVFSAEVVNLNLNPDSATSLSDYSSRIACVSSVTNWCP